ncbi:hypothetical protein KUTeg_011522 [Tegillarca granosa]|uniref:Uncharacterized protein n=1 Tax=Tegillarca granosa TaxID=220873 RepID=A0ABQ9F1A9_TEGGR|nr:hypothetical protein KUTeg_011522 [Tegillarca granosa]
MYLLPSNLCETSTGRTSNVERTNSSSAVVRPSAHSHSQRDGVLQPYQSPPDIRATMTSVQLRTMAAATSALQPFPNITMTPVPAHHSLHHPILQYPTALYPSINAPASNELKHLTLAQYHSVNHHSAFPTDLSKLKSPFINRNYLELAMLVCNTFRGKLFPCPHCRYVT